MPPRKRPDISPAPPRRRQGRRPYMGRRSGLPDATSPSPGSAFPLPRSRGKTAAQGLCGRLAGSAHGAFGEVGVVGRRQFPFQAGAMRRTGRSRPLRRPGQPEPEKSGRAHRLSWRFPPRSVGGGGVGGRTAGPPQSRARPFAGAIDIRRNRHPAPRRTRARLERRNAKKSGRGASPPDPRTGKEVKIQGVNVRATRKPSLLNRTPVPTL